MLVAVDDDRARLLGRAEGHDLHAESVRRLVVAGVILARLFHVVVDPGARLRIEDLRLRGKGDQGSQAQGGSGQDKCSRGDRLGSVSAVLHGFAHPSTRDA